MSETPAPSIRIRLLGPPVWQGPEGSAGELAPRDAALLCVLSIDGPTPRDRLAAWLWPSVPQDRANLSLRQRLFRLRQQCGHPLVEAGLTLRLASDVVVDLGSGASSDGAELLAGQDFSPFEDFDAWLRAARQTMRRQRVDTLSGQAADLEARGALAEALRLCEHIVALEPTREQAWRRLMRLHWRRADRAAAVAVFERFEQVVCREQGLRPSPETLELLSQIERQDPAGDAPALALPPGLLHPPQLIGRAAARQALSEAWAAGRAVMLQAAGGMGKSRLLETFVAGQPGVLRARARPGDATLPYASLSHALDDALAQFSPTLEEDLRAELARVLPRLGPAAPQPAHELHLWQAIERAWRACQAGGLRAIVIDDLHWADAATIEQFRWQLASNGLSGLRMAFSMRPDEDTPATRLLRDWLGDSLRVQPVTLAAWTQDDLDALLPTLGLPAVLADDPDLAAQLLRQTGGQPFFVLETLKTVTLAAAAGAGGAALALAPAVGAMIDRRVQRLAPAARQLLQLLAVAEGQLRLQVAARVLRRPLIDLGRDWADLAAAQLVHDTGVTHDLVRECVLSALPAPTREALHLALAEGLEAEPGVDPASLAPHWQAAGAWRQAGIAWRLAADAALRAGRLAEADELYARATDAHARGADALSLVECLTAAHPTRLMRHGAEAELAALAPHMECIHQPAARARLLLLQADSEMSRMQPQAAVQASTLAWQLVQGLPDSTALRADCAMEHGRALAWSGEIEAGVAMLRQACAEADVAGDLRLRLRARCTLNDVLVPAGQRVESVRHQRDALALTRQLGDRFETAICASNLTVFQLLVGDAAGAYDAGLEAMEAFAAMQAEHVNRLMCAGSFAFAAAHRGRFDEVARHADPLSRTPEGIRGGAADPVRRALRNVLSTVALWRGQPDAAAALLPPADDTSPLSVHLTGLLARLRWCAWTGADDRADRAALQALGDRHPTLRDDAHFYRGWAPWDPPDEAVRRLDRLAAAEAAGGAAALARSLQAVALQIALACGHSDVADRARALHAAATGTGPLTGGWHPALYPPEILFDLARGLQVAGADAQARQVLAEARAWIDAARLPPDDPGASEAFRLGNPVNRRVLDRSLLPGSRGPLTGS